MRASKILSAVAVCLALVATAFFLLKQPVERSTVPAEVTEQGMVKIERQSQSSLVPPATPAEKTAPAEAALLESFNRDIFESEASGWFTQSENGAQATISTVEGGHDDSGGALQVDIEALGTGHEWDIQVVRDNILIEPDSLQTVSAWVKGTAGAEIILSVEAVSDFRLIKNALVVLVGDWQKVVFELDTQEQLVRTAMHFSLPHNEGATILVDEIKMEPSQ